MDDLEGRHLVRVTVPGTTNSPLVFGPLLLDRRPPRISDAAVTVTGDTAEVGFAIDDAGLSGVDSNAPATVAYRTADGVWHPAGRQPTPDAGRKTAGIDVSALPDGTYPVRVTAGDRAGNVGTTSLGTFEIDRTPPVVGAPVIAAAPTVESPSVRIAFTASDDGSGLDPATPAEAVDVDSGAVMARAAAGETSIVVPLPGPGTYRIAVRVTDRAGRVTVSAAITVTDPRRPVDAARPTAQSPVTPPAVPQIEVRRSAVLTPGERWAWGQVRRFHARRGVTMTATPVTARTVAQWSRTLGPVTAARVEAYSTLTGAVALGPATSRGLNRLATLRGCTRCTITPAQSRLMVDALAVTLHETLHASGPTTLADQATTPGRAFEEAFSEAAAIDLLPRMIRSLAVPPRVRTALLRQAPRYRPRYPAELAWARRLSATATGRAASSVAAARWRVTVADTWGADRWNRLATATGRDVDALRTSAPAVDVR